jgi:hypothetical protein
MPVYDNLNGKYDKQTNKTLDFGQGLEGKEAEEFKQKILNGEKTQTLRLYRPGCIYEEFKKGDIVKVTFQKSENLGEAEITEIYKKKIKDLTEDEIKADGFDSKEELLETLNQIYGKLLGKEITEDSEMFVIKFKLIK